MKGYYRRCVRFLFRSLLFLPIFFITNAHASFTAGFSFGDSPSGTGATAEAACTDLAINLNAFYGDSTIVFEKIVNSVSEVTQDCSDTHLNARYPACLLGNGPKGPNYCTNVASVSEVIDSTYTIEVVPAAGKVTMIEPSGGSPSSLDLIAIVKNENGDIQSGVTVQLVVDVQKNSGGHKHDNAARHTKHSGLLSGTSVVPNTVTGLTGIGGYNFTFKSPSVSGNHTVTASCVSVSCGQATLNNILVGVDNLVPLGTGNWVLIGDTPIHPFNHFLTSKSVSRMTKIANFYKTVYSIPLRINDASLVRGGLFDIHANWSTPHKEHRRGTVVDIRANKKAGAIPPNNWGRFQALVRLNGGTSILERSFNKLTNVEVVKNRHFHVRLEGRSE